MDENIGRLLDYLDDSGLAENTVVIYSSDQGWYLGEHGWYDKRWMYEESFRTPLIVRWPGVTNLVRENTQLVQNLDYAQTFLDICGVKSPEDMQGTSIVPLLHGQKPKDWRQVLSTINTMSSRVPTRSVAITVSEPIDTNSFISTPSMHGNSTIWRKIPTNYLRFMTSPGMKRSLPN